MKSMGLARFELRDKLGEGGMGVVYDAYDRERDMNVALKMLRNVDAANVYRFKREFRALRDLSHPNIIALYELVSEGEDWCLTMERLRGQDVISYVRDGRTPGAQTTVSSLLEDTSSSASGPVSMSTAATRTIEPGANGPSQPNDNHVVFGLPAVPAEPTPVGEIVNIERLRDCLSQLARALYALHSAGLVHRDLKPSNVFVTHEDRLVLMDFGIVIDRQPVDPTDKQLMGTPAFMAPEQIRGTTATATAAADWYAFGVLMYVALSGQLPFDGSLREVLHAKLELVPLGLSRLVRGVPRDLEQLCHRLIAIEPDERPRGQAVLDALGVASEHSSFAGDSTFHGSDIFIGRADELATLHQAYRAVAAGRTSCVIVRGPPGMGKTSLIQRFVEELGDTESAESAPLTLRARCQEAENLSYKAFDGVIDALSSYLMTLHELERGVFTPPGVHALTRIFPVLQRIPGWRPTTSLDDLSAKDLRSQAVDALRALLDRVARARPVIIHIDDIHWADRDSVELLLGILEPPMPERLLLVAAMRSDAHDDSSKNDISMMFATLEQRGVAERIELGRLHDNEQRALIRALTVQRGVFGDGDGDIDEQLWADAEGHPLLLAELLWYAMEAPKEAADATGLNLEDVIRRRVSRLPDSARALLETIAVAGEPLPLAVLADAARMSPGERERSLAILRINHLTRTVRKRENQRWLDVYHDKVRETVLTYMMDRRSRALHTALARALEGFTEANPSSLARHWLAAGDARRALAYLVTAAQRAVRSLAVDRAADLFRAAAVLMDDLTEPGEPGEPGEPDRELEVMRCRSWIGLVQTSSTDNVAGKLQLLDSARVIAREYQLVVELANIHMLRGDLLFAGGDQDHSLKEYGTSYIHAQQSDSPACEAQALSGMGHAYFMRGDIGAAESHYNRCIALARKHQLKGFEISNLPVRGLTRYYHCDIEGALDDCRSSLDAALGLQLRRVSLLARSTLGLVLLENGQIDEAGAQLLEAVDSAHRMGIDGFELALWAHVAKHKELIGQPHEGAALIERSLERSSTASLGFAGPVALGALALLTDDPNTRRRALARGEALLDAGAVGHGRLFFYRDAIDTMYRIGDPDEMTRYVRLLDQFTHSDELPWSRLMVARGAALAAHLRGADDAAHVAELERLYEEASGAGLLLCARAVGRALAETT